MHVALQIPELLFGIIERLPDSDKLHFGLTCSLVWSAALPIMWRSVDSTALRGLLGHDLQLVRGVYDDEMLVQSRFVLQTEWERLLHYGRHIHRLAILDPENDRVDAPEDLPLVLLIISVYPGGASMLSKLRTVSLRLRLRRSVTASLFFLSIPFNLTELWISIYDDGWLDPHAVEKLVRTIQPCEELQKLALTVIGSERTYFGRFDPYVANLTTNCRLPKLISLDLAIISDGASTIPQVASLQLLEKLTLDITSGDLPLEPYHLPPTAFPSLTMLTVTSQASDTYFVPNFIMLLKSISSAQFAELEFYGFDTSTLHGALQVIAHKWASTFTSLNLHLHKDVFGEVPAFHVLQPLLACRSLRELFIESTECLNLGDEHLERMASAWPALRALCLDDEWSGPRVWRSKTTRQSIWTLASNCPYLQYLRLTIDFDSVVEPAGRQEVTTESSLTELTELDVGYSHAADPVSVAGFLESVLPNLKVLCSFGQKGMAEVREILALGSFCFYRERFAR